jgi:DNA-binding NarL/FixJ family response regulator
MRFSQLLVCETDGRLAAALESTAKGNRWVLRQPRSIDSSIRLLERSAHAVVVLKVGRDVVRELTALKRICWFFPDVPVVAVTDSDDPALVGLTWDLGAAYVLSGRWSSQHLSEAISGLMNPPSRLQ